jgi:prepilin-type N-terminal cleavage/methylation domain-containing protein
VKIRGFRTAGFTLAEVVIVVAIVALLASITFPNFIKARALSQKKTCIANLKQIDGAINMWALETERSNGDSVDTSELYGAAQYIKLPPICPGRGTYTCYNVGDPVQVDCSLSTNEGHTLP